MTSDQWVFGWDVFDPNVPCSRAKVALVVGSSLLLGSVKARRVPKKIGRSFRFAEDFLPAASASDGQGS